MKNNFADSFSMSVGERIRQLRIKNNLTLEELGKAIKVSRQTIYKYEMGIIKNIPMSKIKALSFLLDTSPSYLMGWQDDRVSDSSANKLYENIRNRRIELELTQDELAKKVGYSDRSMIAKIESGIVDISKNKIMQFAQALDTTSYHLMGLESDQMPLYLNEDKYMSIGDKIYYLRMKNNMTLEELGDKVGVGKSTIRKWENGTISNMRIDKITKLADALGVTPANLLGGANYKEKKSINSLNNNTLKIIDLVNQLNSVGVKKAYDILEDLVSISKYKKQ